MPLKEKLPNQLFNLAFVTVEEILGKNGLNSILNYAKIPHYIGNYPPNTIDLEHPSSDFTRFVSGMVEVLGEKGASSIILLSGIRSFEIMLKDMPGLFALEGVEVKGCPVEETFRRVCAPIYFYLQRGCPYLWRRPLQALRRRRMDGPSRSLRVTGAWGSKPRHRSATARWVSSSEWPGGSSERTLRSRRPIA